MTADDIREAKERYECIVAAHALDARIAQEVLCIPVIPPPTDKQGVAWTCHMSGCGLSYVPSYSERIAAAFEVVGHLERQGLHWEVMRYQNSPAVCICRIGDETDTARAEAETPALAICRAALAWVERGKELS